MRFSLRALPGPAATVLSVFFAAAPGSTVLGSCARPSAAGSALGSEATTTGSALPGLFRDSRECQGLVKRGVMCGLVGRSVMFCNVLQCSVVCASKPLKTKQCSNVRFI